MTPNHFLDEPELTEAAQALFDADVAEVGYVRNLSGVWGFEPSLRTGVTEIFSKATDAGELDFRMRAILVSAAASERDDSYCSLAWGSRLATQVGPVDAAAVLSGDDAALTPAEAAMARWARLVARDPNSTTQEDVQHLRDVGFSDKQIFAMTVYVAARVAFSAVNDALGALPDGELADDAPVEILDTVTFGRPVAR